MSTDFDKNQLTIKMDKSLSVFKKDLNTIRTGRANPAMLDLISIEAYGKKMPINQLSTITVPEPRSISIQVWDKSNVALIDSAIKKSNLGVNPQIDGQILRIHIPQLTEERRLELVKTLKTLGEKGKVSIRNIRRESNDNIKKLLNEKKISEDESKNFEKEIQKVTDMNIEKIDKILSDKEKEILKQ
jgi:ribosome recycling factor